jgi:arginine decarboxylase
MSEPILNADICENAPLYRAALGYIDKSPVRLHTPGHKANENSPCAFMGAALRFDLTELPETDSLFTASGAIREAEELAADYFGTSLSLMSAGGATLCIQAMLRLASCGGGGKIIMARNSHLSAVNALALLGLEPVWVMPRRFAGSSLPGEISPADIAAALERTPGAAAVYITSPDYYGVMSDIGSISAACARFGVPLLVDGAHGAHLWCVGGGAKHPARLGASMVCDSAHKTLPVLTGGAWLHIMGGADRAAAKDAMSLFGSTSPSYPTLISLDLARAWMERSGDAAFSKLQKNVEEINTRLSGAGFFRAPADFDPVRITVDTGSVGLDGNRAAQMLRARGFSPEMSDSRHVVLLPSPFNGPGELEKLSDALLALPRGGAPLPEVPGPELPERVCLPREAVTAPGETVEISAVCGRVSAACSCPCPPGVPAVVPGERINANLAKQLKNYGVRALKVIK